MKKSTIILSIAALVAVSSCQCNSGNKTAKTVEPQELSKKEQQAREVVKADLATFVESTKKIKNLPFEKGLDGEYKLTEKDKMVKPDYLCDPVIADKAVTLTQKYRYLAILGIDKMIAELYDMPTKYYRAAVSKLAIEINDPALKEKISDLDNEWISGDECSELVQSEYDQGREQYFWEFLAAALVEQIYVSTQNVNRFCQMFDDQTAADVTYNFILLHDGLLSLVALYPEMNDLNNALQPLYVINAINVEQLKDQLNELKGEIKVVREFLLK